MLRRLSTAIGDFFFAPVSAFGFGLMRSMWAGVNLFYFVSQWPDVINYYSGAGYFQPELMGTYARATYRFTLLTWVTDPAAVFALYLLFLLALTCMLVGYRAKMATVVSVVLLFSFQEHTFFMFAGGDTMLRTLGFYLVLAPTVSAFSLDRLLQQRDHWRDHGVLLAPLRMSAWPYRMVLWQFIVVYVTAGWYKLLDPLWRNGSGVAVALRDLEFARLPLWAINLFTPGTGLANYLTILMQLAWVLLLIPTPLRTCFVPRRLRRYSLKRVLIYSGFLFHLFILTLMDAGTFSLAMFSGYLGLLLQEDFDALRGWWIWRKRRLATVLYDGRCGFCCGWMVPVLLCDWLHRVQAVDLHNAPARQEVLPDVPLTRLEQTMHVRLPNGEIATGFDGIRRLLRHLPPAWLLLPLLWLPGVAAVGRRLYARVAARRSCTHATCA